VGKGVMGAHAPMHQRRELLGAQTPSASDALKSELSKKSAHRILIPCGLRLCNEMHRSKDLRMTHIMHARFGVIALVLVG